MCEIKQWMGAYQSRLESYTQTVSFYVAKMIYRNRHYYRNRSKAHEADDISLSRHQRSCWFDIYL